MNAWGVTGYALLIDKVQTKINLQLQCHLPLPSPAQIDLEFPGMD